jgi:hypothetical protein
MKNIVNLFFAKFAMSVNVYNNMSEFILANKITTFNYFKINSNNKNINFVLLIDTL